MTKKKGKLAAWEITTLFRKLGQHQVTATDRPPGHHLHYITMDLLTVTIIPFVPAFLLRMEE
jgi:hypothetical protein